MSAAVNAMTYPDPGKVPSVMLALLVHVLLAVFLFFGVRWQSRQPEAVMVELWDSPPVAVIEKAPPAPEIKPEPKPEPKAEPPKPDIALEKKKEKEPPKKSEHKLNFDRGKDIRAELDRESAALNQRLEKDRILGEMKREAAAFAAKADAAYIGKIKGKIKGNIVLPPNIPGNPEAIFDVVQLPTGEIMSVKLRKTSGHKAYDETVERAILKSSPLPRPDRPEQFQRGLEIKFRPRD